MKLPVKLKPNHLLDNPSPKGPMPRKTLCMNILFTSLILAAATFFAYLFFYLGNNTTSVAIIYILAVVFISRYTAGYVPGIISSFVGVICVNYIFTYPFMKFNFTIDGYPVTFAGMVIIASLISTMTSHLKLQSRIIHEREKMLMEAEKETMRANLLRAISHDLRTPLTGIIGASSAYLENQENLSEKEKTTFVKNIYEDSNWLLNMVENLLTITRIRASNTAIHKTSELLEEIVSEAVQRLHKRLPQADIQVHIPEDFLLIPMDATLIEQVLINLMENAYYHGNSHEPIILNIFVCDKQVYLKSPPPNGRHQFRDSKCAQQTFIRGGAPTCGRTMVCFEILDFGNGIPEDKLPTIFDGSPSTPNQSGDSRKGMGIGLTICKTIILAHQGEIHAENHERGAKLSFCLPLREEEENDT